MEFFCCFYFFAENIDFEGQDFDDGFILKFHETFKESLEEVGQP